jgi:hypothetical protein
MLHNKKIKYNAGSLFKMCFQQPALSFFWQQIRKRIHYGAGTGEGAEEESGGG